MIPFTEVAMKKLLLSGIAALFLVTGAAHTEEGWKGQLIGTYECPDVRIELRKLEVHFYELKIRAIPGKPAPSERKRT